jgi:predicted DNA-binding protein
MNALGCSFENRPGCICIPPGLHCVDMERQVSIRLPTRLLNELDRRARQRRRPRADVIRAALAAYVALPDGALDEHPADRVRDLLGLVKGLPTDLATNADHYLADLGRSRR